jgi:putative transposase
MDENDRKRYPSDLSDAEWNIIEPLLPDDKYKLGGPQKTPLRDIMDAIFYINRTGCQWRYLPNDFPPWQTVYYHYDKWRRRGVWQRINEALGKKNRAKEGRNENPSAAIIDSQSVKGTPESGAESSGYDAGKQVKGRKRHVIVDTLGTLLEVLVTAASVQDREGAKELLLKLRKQLQTVQLIWADSGYSGALVSWVKEHIRAILLIVKRLKAAGFHVLPRRWVVERTLAWISRFRRLCKDYERKAYNAESMVYIASIRRLAALLAS